MKEISFLDFRKRSSKSEKFSRKKMPYTMWIKYLLALLIGFGLINSSYGKLSLSQYVAKRPVWEKYFIFRWYVVETAIKRKFFLIVSTNEKRWKYLERVNFSDEKQKVSTQVVETNEKHRQAANPRKYFFHDIFCAQYCHKDIYVHSHFDSTSL